MNNNIRTKMEALQTMQREKLLAVCEITGISITVSLPACTAVMDYRNPLADMKNIVSLLQREEEVMKLPQEILAGMLLASLKRRGLIESHLSSVEQNILLQNATPLSLIKTLLLFVRITKEQATILPHFTVDSQLIVDESKKESTVTNLINSYSSTVQTILFPAQYLDSSRTIATTFTTSTTTKITKAKTVLTQEVKATIRKLISILKEENVAAPKLIEILLLSIQGENLLGLMAKDGIGNKVIAALERYQTPTSLELAMSLKGIARNITAQDSLKQLFVKDLVSVSDESISKPKHSLKELMAMKLGKPLVEGAERSDAQTSNLQTENNSSSVPIVTEEEIDKLEALITSTPTGEKEEEEVIETSITLTLTEETEVLPEEEANEKEEEENDDDI